tara:strand:+ start:4270 stop:4977 length:708 start_codon:yes stop_codon:yes gene_type:complete
LKGKESAIIISTLKASGITQMSLDLYFLDRTILDENISFTLRFYLWQGNWISVGYHQKDLPNHWIKLSEEGTIRIIKRPSGGGAVLHSGGITYALTFKKPTYRKYSYQVVNKWLINYFSSLGIQLKYGTIKKSIIQENCFSSSYTSDLIDQNGIKRVGSAQYWKKGSFLQHGEIQLNPPKELWSRIFKREAPPTINLNLKRNELINNLRNSFLENHPDLNLQNIQLTEEYIKKIL